MTAQNLPRVLGAAVLGLAYGAFLAFCAMMSTAGGDGTYIMFAVFTSPFLLLGIPAAIGGTPLVWTLIGFLVGSLDSRASRFMLVVVMAVQYAAIPLLLAISSARDWRMLMGVFRHEPVGGALYLLVYAVGHVVVWGYFVRHVRKRGQGAGVTGDTDPSGARPQS